MIALYLIAAHFVGDYLLQTRWQAAGKFGWSPTAVAHRIRHCCVYAECFVPVAVYATPTWRSAAFVGLLWILHFLTDSRRFYSTPSDWVAWKRMSREERAEEWAISSARTLGKTSDSLPPSPWGPLPILIDQTLHFVQIAVLAGLLLR